MGMQVVVQHLEKEGFEVTMFQDDPNIDPTLWFQGKHDQPEWVVVRTVTYPANRAERPSNWDKLAENLLPVAKTGHFASVALSSADQPFEKPDEDPVPLWRGHAMHATFEGLE